MLRLSCQLSHPIAWQNIILPAESLPRVETNKLIQVHVIYQRVIIIIELNAQYRDNKDADGRNSTGCNVLVTQSSK